MPIAINGTTGISGVDGSVSAPAVTGTDSNTGITFPAADTIKFATGGVERMSITNSGVTGITAGITMAQMWRIHTIFTAAAGENAMSSNWEAADEASAGYVGSSMSESSGVFTFPSTGIYLIHLNVNFYSSADRRYLGGGIKRTIDNSNYFYVALNYSNIKVGSSITHQSVATSCIFDVSDTSTHKVIFVTSVESAGNAAVYAGSDQNRTWAKFIRLGDT